MLIRNRFSETTLALLASVCAVAFAARCTVAADLSAEKAAKKPVTEKKSEPEKGKYLRVVRNRQDRVVGLETAIVSFAPAGGKPSDVRVDLVAAVHIADKGYYQELNKRFADYDVVLYELVAPEGTRIPKGGRKEKSGNVLSAVQQTMKSMLGLEHQLDQVDYTSENFVHADLSPAEFLQSMRDHNEGFTDIFARLLALAIAKEVRGDSTSDMQLLMAFFDKNRTLALKRAMADQFQEMESTLAILDGPEGSTLIGQRNKRALAGLKKQIESGKKKIAIFYGGGHMADMEKHLRAEFNLVPKQTQWLRAWDMK